MRRIWFAAALMALVAASGCFVGWIWLDAALSAAGPIDKPKLFLIVRGQRTASIGQELVQAGLIADRRLWWAGVVFYGFKRSLKAGEYEIPASASVKDIIALLQDGRTYLRRITFAEGASSAQIAAQIAVAQGLEGALPSVLPEGVLLPETYLYSWGESRGALIQRARKAMQEALAQIWADRSPYADFLSDPNALLILASIVEKETSKEDERAHIAGVFLNRLKRGMRLQSDPTAIYALTKGETPLNRPLSRADLVRPDPFNTYVHEGLPPAPIANPGRASLLAVAQPMITDDLYFVADGNGGHEFARTLEQHNANVARWRQSQKNRGQ